MLVIERRVVMVFDVVFLWLLVSAFGISQVGLAGASVTQWSQTYGGIGDDYAHCVVQTGDGGYALAGYRDPLVIWKGDFLLVKTDMDGGEEWNKTYGGTDNDCAFSLVVTNDSGYALAGYTESFGAGDADFWLVKADSSGNLQWNKTYGGGDQDQAYSLIKTGDGGYALAGMKHFPAFNENDFWFVKTDESGNEEWNKTYGGPYNDDSAWSVIQTDDGGYALAGLTWSFGVYGDFWLIKTDEFGNMQWNKTYGGTDYDYALSVIQTNDGGYALAGLTWSFGKGDDDFWLVKTDSGGNEEWNKTYGGTNDDYAYSVVQTTDGGYALAGHTVSYGVGGGDFWLIKTDEFGNAQWNMTYGGDDTEFMYSMIQTGDGGFALAGVTWSFGVGDGYCDFWLVKTDESGVVPEFPSLSVLPLLTTLTLLVVITAKKKPFLNKWIGL
jgi:hypothetical protein